MIPSSRGILPNKSICQRNRIKDTGRRARRNLRVSGSAAGTEGWTPPPPAEATDFRAARSRACSDHRAVSGRLDRRRLFSPLRGTRNQLLTISAARVRVHAYFRQVPTKKEECLKPSEKKKIRRGRKKIFDQPLALAFARAPAFTDRERLSISNSVDIQVVHACFYILISM